MSSETEQPDWLRFVLLEYDYHRQAIDKFDTQRLQIRTWAITVLGGLLAIAYSSSTPLASLVTVPVTFFFFFLESVYMLMQHEVMSRNNHLEGLIDRYRRTSVVGASEDVADSYVFGISQAYLGTFSFREMREQIFRRGRLHLTAFHAGLLATSVLGAAVAFLSSP